MVLPVGPGHVVGHKGRELSISCEPPIRFPLLLVSPLGYRLLTHLESLQRRTHIGPHLVPFDDVAAVLGVPAHGPGARALVEALVDVLGREPQLAVTHAEKGACGLHFGGCLLGRAVGGLGCGVRVVGGMGGFQLRNFGAGKFCDGLVPPAGNSRPVSPSKAGGTRNWGTVN